jgi:hypothetical protein
LHASIKFLALSYKLTFQEDETFLAWVEVTLEEGQPRARLAGLVHLMPAVGLRSPGIMVADNPEIFFECRHSIAL